jgi:hypothetical protein|tara:strand:- start:439 stop:696 length:258 start_codon:yes stop_codon:yes gene_type:complete
MTNRTKVVVGPNGSETLPLTAEENAARDVQEAEWVAGQTARDALAEIQRLEGEVDARRMREAVLGTDGGWLATQDALIAAERAKL